MQKLKSAIEEAKYELAPKTFHTLMLYMENHTLDLIRCGGNTID